MIRRREPGAPFCTLAVTSLALAFHVLDIGPDALAYRPADPTWTSLILCHLVHFSPRHLLFDALTFFALGVVSESIDRRRYVLFLASASLLIPPLACALDGGVARYAGLSGLVIGQVALWLGHEIRRHRAVWPLPVLLLLLLKQLLEFSRGHTLILPGNYEGFRAIPAAHLLSVLAGSLVGLLPSLAKKSKRNFRARPAVQAP